MADANPNEVWEAQGWDIFEDDYLDEVLNDFLDEFEFSPYE